MDETTTMDSPPDNACAENDQCESHENSTDRAEKKTNIPESEQERLLAEIALMPTWLGADTVKVYSQYKNIDAIALQKELSVQVSQILESNNFDRCEAILLVQIQALDVIFNTFMRRALGQEMFKGLDIFMKQGLKAQAQCRRTIEVLHALRNPMPSVFKQTNIANGPQQVNNGANPDAQNELSAEPSHEGVEALEQLDRTDFFGGQATISAEQQETSAVYRGSHS